MSDPQLMKFFDFDESELQANRNGRLSEKQKARLQNKESITKIGFFVLGAFHFLIAILGPVIAKYLLAGKKGSVLVIGLAILAGFVWLLIWGALGLMFGSRAFPKKMEMTVKKAEGPINMMRVTRSSTNSEGVAYNYSVHELHVGGRVFDVSAKLQDIMIQGDFYAVYYAVINTIGSQDPILSAELLTNASASYISQPVSMDDPQVVDYLKKGDVLRAIKAHRSIHNSSFAEAKAVVEDIKSRLE